MDELNNKVQIISSDDILVKYDPLTDKVYLELDRNKVNLITQSEKNKLQNIDENANNLYHNMIVTNDENEKITINGEDYFLPIGSKKAIHTYNEIKEAIGDDKDFIDIEGKEIIENLKEINLDSIKFFLAPVLTTDSLPDSNINSGSICFVKNQKDIYFLNENNEWESLTNRIRQNVSLEGLQDDIDIILTENNVINNIINRITANERNITLTSTEISDNKTILESQIKQNARLISSTVSEFKYDFEDFFKVDLYDKNNPNNNIASSNNNKIFLNQSTGEYFKSNGNSWELLNTPNPTLFGSISPSSDSFTYSAEDYNNVVYLRTDNNIEYYKSNGETWNLLENIIYKIPIPTLFGCGIAKDFYDINSIIDDGNEYYSNHYRGYVNTTNGKFSIAFYNNKNNKWEWIFIKTLKLLPETIKSSIEQTAREIRTEVSNEVDGIQSSISQTAKDLTALITSNDGRISILEDTVDGLTSTTLNSDEEIGSSIKQTASSISSTVGEFKYDYSENGFFKVDFYDENDPDSNLAITNNNKIYLKQTSDNNCKYFKSNGNIWEEIDTKVPSINSQYPPTTENINNGNFTIQAENYLNKYILIYGGDLYKSNGTNWEIVSDKNYRYPIPTLFGITSPQIYYNPSTTSFHYKGYVNTTNGKYYICYYDITDNNWKWFYVKLLNLLTSNIKSEINQKVNEINSRINDLDGNNSEINQKIDSINMSVIQSKYNFNYDENDITTRFLNVSYYSKDLESMSQEELNLIQYTTGDIKLDQDNYRFYIYKNSNWIEFDPNNLSDINHPYYKENGINLNSESVSKKFYPIPTLFNKYSPTNSKNPYKIIKEEYHNRTYVRTISNRVYICKFDIDSNKWKWIDTGRNIKFINDIFRSSIQINSDNITSEVTRATNAENSLSTQIKQTEKNIALSVSEGKYDYDCKYEGSSSSKLFLSKYEAPSLFGSFGSGQLNNTYPPSLEYLNKVFLNNENGEHFVCIEDSSTSSGYKWQTIISSEYLNTFINNNKISFPKPSLFGPGTANIYYPNPDDDVELHYRTYLNTNENYLVACLKDPSDNRFKWYGVSHVKFISDALKSEIELTNNSIESRVSNAMSGYSSQITQNSDKINLMINNAFTGSGSSLSLNPEKIKMSWNSISDYIEFSNGAMSIYKNTSKGKMIEISKNGFTSYNNDSTPKKTISVNNYGFISYYSNGIKNSQIDNNGYKIYDSNGKIKMKLNGNGTEFYDNDDNTLIGGIGCSSFTKHPSIKGIRFRLENTGEYLTWSYVESQGSNAITKFSYFPHYIDDTVNNDQLILKKGFHFDDFVYFNKEADFNNTVSFYDNDLYTISYNNTNPTDKIRGFQNGSGTLLLQGYTGVNLESLEAVSNYGNFTYNTKNYIRIKNTSIDIGNNSNSCTINMRGSMVNNSDIRLKTNINDYNKETLRLINKIKLKSFDWIESNKHEEIGIIAQELKNIIPDLVVTDEKTSLLSIKTNNLIFYLIKAIQELIERLNITFDNSDIIDYVNEYSEEDKNNFIQELNNNREENNRIKNIYINKSTEI